MARLSGFCFTPLMLLCLLFAAPARAEKPLPDQPLAYMQGLNNASHEVFLSETLGRQLHLFIRLPESYGTAGETFPVLYLLDGGHTFPMLASYYRYLVFAEEIPEMIIVGIGYGADGFNDGNTRGADFTAPSPERAHFGGAGKFQAFFKDELLPHIETLYTADPERRIIFGQSLGGQFVLYSAQTDPELFWGRIASNPALHRNLPFFLSTRPANASGKLFVSSAAEDEPQFREPAIAWIKHWTAEVNLPWKLKTLSIPGHGHFSAAPEALRQGLKWLFEGERPR